MVPALLFNYQYLKNRHMTLAICLFFCYNHFRILQTVRDHPVFKQN